MLIPSLRYLQANSLKNTTKTCYFFQSDDNLARTWKKQTSLNLSRLFIIALNFWEYGENP